MPHRPQTAIDAVDESSAPGRHGNGVALMAPPLLFILYGSIIHKATLFFFPTQPPHLDILLLVVLTATACTHMTVLLGKGLRDALRPAEEDETAPPPYRYRRWEERHHQTQRRTDEVWAALFWRNYRVTFYAIYLFGSGGALYLNLLRTLDP